VLPRLRSPVKPVSDRASSLSSDSITNAVSVVVDQAYCCSFVRIFSHDGCAKSWNYDNVDLTVSMICYNYETHRYRITNEPGLLLLYMQRLRWRCHSKLLQGQHTKLKYLNMTNSPSNAIFRMCGFKQPKLIGKPVTWVRWLEPQLMPSCCQKAECLIQTKHVDWMVGWH